MKVDIVDNDDPSAAKSKVQILRFRVQEVLKGSAKRTIFLRDSYGGSCDTNYKAGDSFIAFSSSGDINSDTFNINEGITYKDDEDFNKELEYCRQARKGLVGATISGVLVRSQRDSITDSVEYKGIIGIKVLVQGSQSKYELKTDEKGRFFLYGLKPDIYRITFNVYNWYGEPISDELNLNEEECEEAASASITEQSNITGTLIKPNGELAAKVEVQLIAIDPTTNKPTTDTLSVLTDENGHFGFANIPEGKYLLAHNYVEAQYDGQKHALSFYPETNEISSASIIDVKTRQDLNLGMFKLLSNPK
jgi:hypothetical protein